MKEVRGHSGDTHPCGTFNQFGYKFILADHIHRYMLIVVDVILQQYNVTWLEKHDQDFQVLPSSPDSPDLNPTEHL